MPEMLEVRKQALNVLTIFSDNCTVRFCHSDGKVEQKRGWWCTVCKWETIRITEANTYQNSKETMKPISRNMGNGRHSMSDLICHAASISVTTIHCTRSVVPSRAWWSTTTLYPERLPEKGSKLTSENPGWYDIGLQGFTWIKLSIIHRIIAVDMTRVYIREHTWWDLPSLQTCLSIIIFINVRFNWQ